MGQPLSSSDSQLYKRIDEIVWNNWDPIEVNKNNNARDEYYEFLPVIYEMVKAGATQSEIADHLYNLETKSIGTVGSKERCNKAAELLTQTST